VGETQPKSRGGLRVKPQGGSRTESQGESSTKPQSKSQVESQGGARSRQSSVNQLDVDGVLVGRRVSIAVVVGDRIHTITGTIMAMGRYWVVVNIEDSEIQTLQGTVYLNKGSIIAYIPVPSETPGSNHDSKTKA